MLKARGKYQLEFALRWSAPEVIKKSEFSFKSDAWSKINEIYFCF